MKKLSTFLIENDTHEKWPDYGPDSKYAAISAIIEKGAKHHVDRFVHAEEPEIRALVAKRGFEDHLDTLIHDPSYQVEGEIARSAPKEYVDRLVNEKLINNNWPQIDTVVEVADRGFKDHAEALSDHVNPWVRAKLAKYTLHKDVLNKLAGDPDEHVRQSAERNLHNQVHYGSPFHFTNNVAD